MPYENEVYISNNIKVGAFLLPEDMIKSLSSIDLANFNTSKVRTMRSMFSYCESLVSIDLSNLSNFLQCTVPNRFLE